MSVEDAITLHGWFRVAAAVEEATLAIRGRGLQCSRCCLYRLLVLVAEETHDELGYFVGYEKCQWRSVDALACICKDLSLDDQDVKISRKSKVRWAMVCFKWLLLCCSNPVLLTG